MRKNLIAAVLFCLCLSSCSANSSTQKELKILIDMGSNEYTAGIEDSLDSFEKANTDIKLEVEYIKHTQADMEAGYTERNAAVKSARTALLSGSGADIIIIYDKTFSSGDRSGGEREALIYNPYKSMQSGSFLPLNDVLGESEAFKNYSEALKAAGSLNGTVFIIPLKYNVIGLQAEESVISALNLSQSNAAEELNVLENAAVYIDYLSSPINYFGGSLLDYSGEKVNISKADAAQWAQLLNEQFSVFNANFVSEQTIATVFAQADYKRKIEDSVRFIT